MRTKKLKAARVGVIGKVLRILELLDRSRSGLNEFSGVGACGEAVVAVEAVLTA